MDRQGSSLSSLIVVPNETALTESEPTVDNGINMNKSTSLV